MFPGKEKIIKYTIDELWGMNVNPQTSKKKIIYDKTKYQMSNVPKKEETYGLKFEFECKYENLPEKININDLTKHLTLLQSNNKFEYKNIEYYLSHSKIIYAGDHRTLGRMANDENTLSVSLNFADEILFGYCETNLFAQDEIQVAEIPMLRKWKTVFNGSRTLVGDKKNNSLKVYPHLFMNVKRVLNIDTKDIYGKNFSDEWVDSEVIENRCHVISPPQNANILAISALRSQSMIYKYPYTENEIFETFCICYAGFKAATVSEIKYTNKKKYFTLVSTGNLGCGAFGGNPVLMTIIQILAAYCAHVNILVYHPMDKNKEFYEGIEFLDRLMDEEYKQLPFEKDEYDQETIYINTRDLMKYLASKKFYWNASDGN